MEEVQALLGDGEDLVRVEVPGQRLAAGRGERDLQRGAVGELAAVVVAHHVVRAGHHGGEVAGDRPGGREPPGPDLALGGHGLVRAVGVHVPGGRRGHREGVGRLQVRLLEGGEHPAGVGRFEVRVEVRLAVDRVDEAVQALARAAVRAVRVDHQDVLLGQALDRHPGAVEDHRRVELAPVQADGPYGGRQQVHEGGRTGGQAAELDCGGGPEGGRGRVHGRGHVEVDPVAVHGEDVGPLLGFVAAQVLTRHGRYSFVRRARCVLRWDGAVGGLPPGHPFTHGHPCHCTCSPGRRSGMRGVPEALRHGATTRSDRQRTPPRDHCRFPQDRRLLVRAALPLGLDDLPLDAGGRAGAPGGHPLARDEPGGAERAQREPPRAVPGGAGQGVGPGPGADRRRRGAR